METESQMRPRSWVPSARCDIARCSSCRVHGVSQNATFTRLIPSRSADRWPGNRNFVNRHLNNAHSLLERISIGGPAGAVWVGVAGWLMRVRLLVQLGLSAPRRL